MRSSLQGHPEYVPGARALMTRSAEMAHQFHEETIINRSAEA